MACIKCGRETDEDQLFCDGCCTDMLRYPVKPNIVVQLPVRKEKPLQKRQPKRRAPTAEDTIRRLRKRCRVVTVLWLVTLLLLSLTIYPTVEYYFGETVYAIGQNYHLIGEVNDSLP